MPAEGPAAVQMLYKLKYTKKKERSARQSKRTLHLLRFHVQLRCNHSDVDALVNPASQLTEYMKRLLARRHCADASDAAPAVSFEDQKPGILLTGQGCHSRRAQVEKRSKSEMAQCGMLKHHAAACSSPSCPESPANGASGSSPPCKPSPQQWQHLL